MNIQYSQYSAFSIIEVLVGIFVFSLGLVSIFAVLTTSLSINERNKNAIIASNLAREQIELLRNIRDTNYKNVKVWNQYEPGSITLGDTTNPEKVFFPGSYYRLENDLDGTGYQIDVEHLGSSISEGISEITAMNDLNTGYRLCLNSENIYTYKCSGVNTETPFYRYLYISDKVANDDGTDSPTSLPGGALRVVSKVIWMKRGYYEFDIQTIITDWRRI